MRVLVIGDSCIDEYIYCKTNRFCPDAPVPILKPESYVSTEGMAGNVADNLRALDIEVDLISNANQIKKTRFVDDRTNHMFVRIDEGENDIFPIEQKTLENIDWNNYDAVVISDYDKGFLEWDQIDYIAQHHPMTFLDTKKEIDGWAHNVKFIKINEIELDQSIGFLHDNEDEFAEKVITTLGSKGAQYKGVIYPVEEVDVRDTSGAGDTFLAGFVYQYLENKSVKDAIKFANKCSTQIVQKKGTAKINLKEL
jgi:bifunctional ADP-heptose synthase (sugar kinase/adenylyltransferase)|tara:strand:- start:328 stop:1086 length:759 start_codon:yes stop_codon:yes gene_type:complete